MTALTAVAVCAIGAAFASQALGATIEEGTNAMLAIYGSPPAAGPVGGGLGRNFGFGSNMLFEANTTSPRKAISITVGTLTAKSEIAEIGGTVMSNKTGVNNPLSFSIQFADFQKSTVTETATASFSDTSDRPWISEICPPIATTKECRVDPRGTEKELGAPESSVKIEDVSVNLGPGFVVQGTVWGTFINGTTTTPACISLNLPPEKVPTQTLVITQTPGGAFPAVGVAINAISGEACLVSANNYYYPGNTTHAITIANE
jgi:hypothetical protein